MEALFRFLAANEIPIYIILALSGLWLGRRVSRALQEWRHAVFGLERAIARQRFISNVIYLGLILMLAVFQFAVTTLIIPSLPYTVVISTPTLAIVAGTMDTSLLPPELGGTPVPSPVPVANSEGCIPDRLAFTSPQPGQEVSQSFELKGVINVPNFGFYKYEVAPAGSENWATISAGDKVGEDGELGLWDTTALTPGDYLLRLVVTDNEGNILPPCVIPVRVKGP